MGILLLYMPLELGPEGPSLMGSYYYNMLDINLCAGLLLSYFVKDLVIEGFFVTRLPFLIKVI